MHAVQNIVIASRFSGVAIHLPERGTKDGSPRFARDDGVI
jgi:hypothetical protein